MAVLDPALKGPASVSTSYLRNDQGEVAVALFGALTRQFFWHVKKVCNLKWLGLRSSHIAKHSYIGYDGEPLTDRDRSILDGLQRNTRLIRESSHYMEEVQAMKRLGKYELQWLYGHASGANYLEHFVLESILCADYI